MIILGILCIAFTAVGFYIIVRLASDDLRKKMDRSSAYFALVSAIIVSFLLNYIGVFLIVRSNPSVSYIIELQEANKIVKVVNLEINENDTIKVVKYKVK